MNKKHLIGYAATAAIALAIGGATGASGSGNGTVAASTPEPAVTATATVTKTTPGPTETVTVPTPGPTVTVTSPKPAKTVTVKVTPKPKAAMSGDGTFEVGVDIKPGTYVSSAPDSGNCYWARLSGSGGFDDIRANNNSSGQSLVTILPSDKFFESSGCNDWTKR